MALVLPQLLTLMDDYETFYRDQGLKCLDVVLEKVDARTLKRMGIDNLFLKVRCSKVTSRMGYQLI
jgi:hypothetical protein